MKNAIIILVLVLLLSSCAKEKTINGITYQPYGLLNPEKKVDSVNYSIPFCGVVAGVVFCEVIIPPIYVFGYDFYQPESIKTQNKP